MGLFKTFTTNQEREVQGTEVKYEANPDGTMPTFVIARKGGANKRYTRAMEREYKPYQRLLAAEKCPPETIEKCNLNIFLSSILLGWSNVQNEDGSVIEFNAENARKIMTMLPDLFTDLWYKADQASMFQDDYLENATKN